MLRVGFHWSNKAARVHKARLDAGVGWERGEGLQWGVQAFARGEGQNGFDEAVEGGAIDGTAAREAEGRMNGRGTKRGGVGRRFSSKARLYQERRTEGKAMEEDKEVEGGGLEEKGNGRGDQREDCGEGSAVQEHIVHSTDDKIENDAEAQQVGTSECDGDDVAGDKRQQNDTDSNVSASFVRRKRKAEVILDGGNGETERSMQLLAAGTGGKERKVADNLGMSEGWDAATNNVIPNGGWRRALRGAAGVGLGGAGSGRRSTAEEERAECEGEGSAADAGAVKGKAVKSNATGVGEEAWWENYELLLLFKSLNGHAHILKSEPLGLWVKEQRQAFQRGRLVRGREKLLRDAGFEFDGAYAAPYRDILNSNIFVSHALSRARLGSDPAVASCQIKSPSASAMQ